MVEKDQRIPQQIPDFHSPEKNNSKGVWFAAEHKDGKLEKAAFLLAGECKSLATKLGEETVAIIMGHQIKDLAAEFAPYGIDKAFVIEDKRLEKYTGDTYVDALAQVVSLSKPSIILFATTPMGNDLAPRLAAKLKVGLLARYTEIAIDKDKKLTARRPIHSGKAQATVTLLRKPLVATVDPQLLTLQKSKETKEPQVTECRVNIDSKNNRTRLIDYLKADPCAVCVSEAEIVIGVGKGLACAENLKPIEELARILGASIGGSRRATDERWIVDEKRIGLTGKTIAPKLYLICGISGAFHHTLSIKGSQLMVAINTDRNAPIAKMADLVLVGDMQQIIPELTKQLREVMKPTT
jgi:electron transfer flavoprotein alpha subunit